MKYQNDAVFQKALNLARQTYNSQNKDKLGKLLSVSEQLVAGYNYKMTFETLKGREEIIVFAQSWTNTYQVISMRPIPGKAQH
jgi:hypothetical protein